MLILYIYWDPSRELIPWSIPILDRPILWYGALFALGFLLGYLVFQKLAAHFLASYRVSKTQSIKCSERVSFYIVLGAVFGARLGDILFYQNLGQYLQDPFAVFRFWEGGLASHGAVIGILVSLWIFCLRIKGTLPMLTWVAMLDLLAIPALLAGGWIRIGNFFNQEILGTVTTLPWGVIFGHPVDGLTRVARHPVQLYEALFYFGLFALLWTLRSRVPKFYRLGKTSGYCLLFTFTFRFCIEFIKAPQGVVMGGDPLLSMGQLLSIPLVLFGGFLLFYEQHRIRTRSV